jgi:hypothetical protein
MHRALLLAVVLLGALPTAVATAAQPRIVNGQPAQDGVYPSQGFLAVDVGGRLAGCAGTVVAPTKFVTAAHCVAGDDGLPRPPSAFSVFLGEINRSEFRNAEQPVVAAATVHPDYAEDRGGNTDDVAVLTFDAPVAAAPTRIIRPAETALWAPGAIARIIGWGATFEGGSGTNELRQADAPIRSDAVCSDPNAYGEFFIATTMVCAGAADGSSTSTDTCQGDSGGPLLVGSQGAWALAGVVSWGNGCNRRGFPGIYTRVGAPALNAWVRGQASGVDFTLPVSPRTGEPAAFTATAPAGAAFAWDFDDDGAFDATGPTASHVYATAGEFEAVLRITDAEGQPAEQRHELLVAPGVAAPPSPPPPPTPPVVAPGTPRLATILVSGRPKVKSGRFRLRITFAATAPRGTATIEVFKGTKKIGSATTRVRRGGAKRVSIKLNKAGRRLLSKSATGRLRVRVRVRVGRRVLRSKELTIRR